MQPEVGQRVDHQLLDRAHVGDGVGHAAPALARHRQDRVADELAGAVVGDVAAAVGATSSAPTDAGGTSTLPRSARTPSV